MPLHVDLVSADSSVWSGDATFVVARTTEGELGILPGHAPLLAVLAEGDVRITADGGQDVVFTLASGFLSVEHDRVTLLSDSATVGSGTPSGPGQH